MGKQTYAVEGNSKTKMNNYYANGFLKMASFISSSKEMSTWQLVSRHGWLEIGMTARAQREVSSQTCLEGKPTISVLKGAVHHIVCGSLPIDYFKKKIREASLASRKYYLLLLAFCQ